MLRHFHRFLHSFEQTVFSGKPTEHAPEGFKQALQKHGGQYSLVQRRRFQDWTARLSLHFGPVAISVPTQDLPPSRRRKVDKEQAQCILLHAVTQT